MTVRNCFSVFYRKVWYARPNPIIDITSSTGNAIFISFASSTSNCNLFSAYLGLYTINCDLTASKARVTFVVVATLCSLLISLTYASSDVTSSYFTVALLNTRFSWVAVNWCRVLRYSTINFFFLI